MYTRWLRAGSFAEAMVTVRAWAIAGILRRA